MDEYLFVVISKNLFINIFMYYTFCKLLDIKRLNPIKVLLSATISTAIYVAIKTYFNSIFAIIIMYFIQIFLLEVIINVEQRKIMTSMIIADSIVYVIFTLSTIIESVFRDILKISNNLINFSIILVLHIFINIIIFKTRRLKDGLAFLKNQINRDYLDIIMVSMSALVILAYCLFGNYYGNVTKSIFLSFIILIVIMTIMIQKTLTLYYQQKLLLKANEDYQKEIASKDEQIKKLSEEKFKISKLNHEFYNRQKALENKVKDFISESNAETSSEISIIESINNLSKSYSSELEKIKSLDKLPVTDIEEIDDMFKYMQSECKNNNIDFKLQVNGNIHHMVNKIIPQDRLVTLIGDHLRDAIIAINAGDNKFRSILAILGVKNECYELCVYDSGVEFTIDTLEKLGIEPITTHKDSGGSGIGFITTFETMRQTGASLIIDEKCKPSENDYTKSVVIRFDGKNEYRIFSYRAKKIKNKIKDNRAIIKDRI